MIRKLLLLALVAVLLPSSVYAQAGDVKLASVEVDLWPEYDRPSMLVMYNLELPASASLPYPVELRIPTAAGEPHAVAARETDTLVNLAYTSRVEGDWNVLSFNATSPQVRIEYYDPGLEKNGAARSFTYTWPGDYAVDSFVVQVQQPLGATNMQIEPTSLGSGSQDPAGLVYYTAEIGAIPDGQPLELRVRYDKESDALSSENLPVEPSAPISSSTNTGLSLPSVLPWLLGGLGLLLIVGGGVWYWQSGREKSRPPARRVRGRASVSRPAATTAGPETAPAAGEGKFIYCHQCGKRAAAGDRFCRTCGAQLRGS